MYWRYCDRINISCGEIPFLVFLSDVIIKWNSALNEMFLGCSACHSFPRLLHYSLVPFVQQQQFNGRIALFHTGSSGMCGKLRSSAVGHALLLLVDSSKSVYLAGLNTCGWLWLCCGKLGRVFIKLCPAGNLFSFWKYDRTVLLHAARLYCPGFLKRNEANSQSSWQSKLSKKGLSNGILPTDHQLPGVEVLRGRGAHALYF